MSSLFSEFSSFIKSSASGSFGAIPTQLKISEEGRLSIYYSPFDHINPNARIVICGITPGLQQASIALETAAESMRKGATEIEALAAAKSTASFAGSMRKNLIRMLDYCGVNQKIGIESCSELFADKKELLHTTSVLRYPVFVNGMNYSGSPAMLKTSLLKEQIDKYLIPEIASLNPEALFVPLGETVAKVLFALAQQGVLKEEQILAGMPHPSGANAERIKFFLGEKAEKDLSEKTNPFVINAAKAQLMKKLSA